MILRTIMGLALASLLAGACLAAEPDPKTFQPSPTALPAMVPPVTVAQGNSCANACQTEHDQCRVVTKGSPSCDAQRQRCLQACIASKRK